MDDNNNSLVEIESSIKTAIILNSEYRFTKDPSFITNFLKVMLNIYLLVNCISLTSNIMQMNLLNNSILSITKAKANDLRQDIITLTLFVTIIITGIIFLIWIYRANLNCHGFTTKKMKYTPGWSIGWYFIPFACYYKPYKVMEEIYNISENPQDWENKTKSGILTTWWTLCLLSSFLGQISLRFYLYADTINSLKILTVVDIISNIIDISLIFISYILVSKIIERENRLVRKI